ncbi:MAG: hypothetical protein M1823_004659 [Watsoniomyces obsoletus]|nr:MAG: hypothetical protein M1823_004659 [Watsoniomyces obsoletus]
MASAPLRLMARQNAPPTIQLPPGLVPNYDNPVTRGHHITNVSLAFGILAFIVVTLRVITKVFLVRGFGWDDVLSVFALLLAEARAVCSVILAERIGIGRHTWDVKPMYLALARNVMYIQDMLYLIAIMSAKLSILMLYLRLFQVKKLFRTACYILMVITVGYCVSFFFMYAFNCRPLKKTWNALDPTPGTCIDVIMMHYVVGSFNIATDFAILLLPMPLVWQLQLKMSQKIGLLGIFATGAFVCVTTIVRQVIVVRTLRDFDQAWVVVEEIIWLTIELCVGIICGCLPVMVPLYGAVLAGKFIPSSLRSFVSKHRTGSTSSASGSGGDSNSSKLGDSNGSEKDLAHAELGHQNCGTQTSIAAKSDRPLSETRLGPAPHGAIVQTYTLDTHYANAKG